MTPGLALLIVSLSISPDAGTARTFDHTHAAWTDILQRHVERDAGVGVVDYGALQADVESLDRYVAELSEVSQSAYDQWTAAQQLAFLINAYNAFTFKLILANYPVDSIKDLGGWFRSPWKKRFFRLFGDERHLDDIEHGMIRKQFDEPRIHFAVNCAAAGCPPLRGEAYVAERLDTQLEDSARRFLRDPRRNRYVPGGSRPTLELSSVMDWYRGDFSKHGQSLRDFVAARISDDPAVIEAIRSRQVRVRFLDYDWSLNDR